MRAARVQQLRDLLLISRAIELRLHRVRRCRHLTECEGRREDLDEDGFHRGWPCVFKAFASRYGDPLVDGRRAAPPLWQVQACPIVLIQNHHAAFRSPPSTSARRPPRFCRVGSLDSDAGPGIGSNGLARSDAHGNTSAQTMLSAGDVAPNGARDATLILLREMQHCTDSTNSMKVK